MSASSNVSATPRGRALVIGDDASVTTALASALRLAGHEVWTCGSPQDGLALAHTHHPQVVLIDLRTTQAASVALARRLRAIPGLGTTALVIITGAVPAEIDRSASDVRGVELRYRPVWLQELVALTTAHLITPVHDPEQHATR